MPPRRSDEALYWSGVEGKREPGDTSTVTAQIVPEDDGWVPPAEEDRTNTKTVSPDDAYALEPGTVLGEYTIEAKIGEGGMGQVYAATHPVIGKHAAVKILNKELCSDQAHVDRFIDEARVVNQIQHPNIVDIFAFGETVDGRVYFVMEWLKGESLRERIARGTMTPAEVEGVLRPLCQALQAAHEKGIIHRDLKPDNVFFAQVRDAEPRVTLLDFGIAKLVHRDRKVEKTATGAMVGTPQYVAPEQAKGHAIDARVDIYALGAIAFEMLTGGPPFVADNAMEVVAKHLMEPPRRVSEVVRGVPRELDDLVHAMLSKQAEGRPSLDDIFATLERVRTKHPRLMTRQPIRLPPPSGPIAVPAVSSTRSAIQPLARRKRLWIGLAVAGAIGCFALAFVAVNTLGKRDDAVVTPPPPSPAPEHVAPAPVPVTPAIVDAPASVPEIDIKPPVAQPPKPRPVVRHPPPVVKKKPPPLQLPDDDNGLIQPRGNK
jgi:serine/threonine-protein kinase